MDRNGVGVGYCQILYDCTRRSLVGLLYSGSKMRLRLCESDRHKVRF